MTGLRLVATAIAAAVAVAGGGAAASRSAGSIRGRVSFVDAAVMAERRPVAPDSAAGAHVMVDRRRSVVYLESAPREAFEVLPAQRERMDQRFEQFMPRVLAITVGSIVEFPNHDTTFHNVFSLSRAKTFDLGRYPPAHTGSVRFDQAGIVQVFCDIHQHMRAYIFVFSHPFFALTEDDGRYSIGAVPPGAYSLAVWSELGRAGAKRVTVADGGVSDVDFTIGRQP